MKFTITFKDPDGVYDCVTDVGGDRDKLMEFLSNWIEFQEYITIEFDTEAKTAVVVSRD